MRFTTEKKVMSEINVTPFVDVMLVLLIIFMVTAPLLKQGLDVDLPRAKGKELPAEERIMVSVKKDGKIYLNRRAVSLSELTRKLRAISKRNPTLYLQADRRVPYGEVVKIMDILMIRDRASRNSRWDSDPVSVTLRKGNAGQVLGHNPLSVWGGFMHQHDLHICGGR